MAPAKLPYRINLKGYILLILMSSASWKETIFDKAASGMSCFNVESLFSFFLYKIQLRDLFGMSANRNLLLNHQMSMLHLLKQQSGSKTINMILMHQSTPNHEDLCLFTAKPSGYKLNLIIIISSQFT
jgi:hypothetical protein